MEPIGQARPATYKKTCKDCKDIYYASSPLRKRCPGCNVIARAKKNHRSHLKRKKELEKKYHAK